MKQLNHLNDQRGFSLVEILVTLTISAIILAGVLQISAGGSHTASITKGMSNIQENARFAFTLLSKNIRMTSYQGCADFYRHIIAVDRNSLLANDVNFANYIESSLAGYEVTSATQNSWADGTLLTGIETVALPDSDIISIYQASSASAPLTADMANTASNIQIGSNVLGFATGELLMISSCKDAAIFRASDVTETATVTLISHAATANSSATLPSSFKIDDSSILHRVTFNTYYIRNNDAQIPSLYRYSLMEVNGTEQLVEEEIVQGIDNMQILYGQHDARGTLIEQSDDRVNFLAASDSDLDMSLVNVIRVSLLVRSTENMMLEDGEKNFNMLGQKISLADSDKKMRKVFSTTIKLRNREVYQP